MANVSRVRRSPQPHHAHRVLTDEELDATAAWKQSYWREMRSHLRHDGGKEDVECCPSVMEMVAKKGGKTPTGLYVELYEDGENKQRLYELSCAPGVVDKPCRFVDARLYNQSRCVQKYSYSYALVRYSAATETPHARHRTQGHFSVPGSGGWSMDYVIVRAGCECQITPPKRKTGHRKRMERHKRLEKHKQRSKRLGIEDDKRLLVVDDEEET
ncbi:hypothetical protein O0L34_g15300 [Tuta absoluta]|nr:hypothetical protein O0L34_g15300 [Tuta absoluta]